MDAKALSKDFATNVSNVQTLICVESVKQLVSTLVILSFV
jgi:hypothetical protein